MSPCPLALPVTITLYQTPASDPPSSFQIPYSPKTQRKVLATIPHQEASASVELNVAAAPLVTPSQLQLLPAVATSFLVFL